MDSPSSCLTFCATGRPHSQALSWFDEGYLHNRDQFAMLRSTDLSVQSLIVTSRITSDQISGYPEVLPGWQVKFAIIPPLSEDAGLKISNKHRQLIGSLKRTEYAVSRACVAVGVSVNRAVDMKVIANTS